MGYSIEVDTSKLREILTPRQFDAMCLYYGEGHSGKVVAEYMGTTKQAVSKLLKKAKRNLSAHGIVVPHVYRGGARKVRVAPSVYEVVP